jgi:peptide/nickel transport system substrate-binding protein
MKANIEVRYPQQMAGKLIVCLMAFSLILAACTATPQPVRTSVSLPTVANPPTGAPTPFATLAPIPVSPPPTALPTPTQPLPTPLPGPNSPKPDELTNLVTGDVESLDPALAYDDASIEVLRNLYDTLVQPIPGKPDQFAPRLAEQTPSQANGGISADGRTYTFKLRTGARFLDGSPVAASDAAYSLIRGILQAGSESPQWLLTEPLFGTGITDVALLAEAAVKGYDFVGAGLSRDEIARLTGRLMDDREALKRVDSGVLLAICEAVKTRITADDSTRTLTIRLARPWSPWLATLAQPWGSILSRKWVIENRGWNGDCQTWTDHYAPTPQNDPINSIVNGSGPYMLERWIKGQEVVLNANDTYWRRQAAYPGGPVGAPRLKRIIIRIVPDFDERLKLFQMGQADLITIDRQKSGQLDALVGERCEWNADAQAYAPCRLTETSQAGARLYVGEPVFGRTDIFMNFDVTVDAKTGTNSYIGSGKLDGNGIPAGFFANENIRKAFQYCFDSQAYIREAFNNEAVRSAAVTLPGLPGYTETAPQYRYDVQKCADLFKSAGLRGANGKTVWDVGFRFKVVINTGSSVRKSAARILAAGLKQVNEKFVLEVEEVSWSKFRSASIGRLLPLFIDTWQEDIHDSHNWYSAYLTGYYALSQGIPLPIRSDFQKLLDQAAATPNPAERTEIYMRLNQGFYDFGLTILGAAALDRRYEQRWVLGVSPGGSGLIPGGYDYYTLYKR